MSETTIKNQLNDYLPLLTSRQQELVLELVKSILKVDDRNKRISKKQYNKELEEAIARVEEEGGVYHKDALMELSKW